MVIITGSSSGIGKALALFYLQKGEKVIGISRSNNLEHENFTFVSCDLSKIEAIQRLDLSPFITNESIVLVNNAGTIGKIKRAEELDLETYNQVAVLNIVAVQYLCSYLLKNCEADQLKAIVNISSGAGSRPISAWSAYCASKAAIDLYTETLHAEFKETGRKTNVYSVAPGVVDTNMQVEIRDSNPKDFSSHQNFIDLKKNNELRSPEKVAVLLHELLLKDQGEVVTRLSE
jgi:benzil reductase ((S)-benzoin forming)